MDIHLENGENIFIFRDTCIRWWWYNTYTYIHMLQGKRFQWSWEFDRENEIEYRKHTQLHVRIQHPQCKNIYLFVRYFLFLFGIFV